MSNQTKTHDVNLTLTSNAFTRTGYTFTGWNTAANGSGTSYANGATYTANAGVTLYAQWILDVSGSLSASPSTVVSGATSTITWYNIQNATSCTIEGAGETWTNVTLSGSSSSTRPLSASSNYVLNCDGQAVASASITVLSQATLSATPRIVQPPENSTVHYNTYGQSCTLSGGTIGTVPVSGEGSYPVSGITARTTFRLTCPIGAPADTTVEIAPRVFES
jgi:uncharacterized repeat protein (TIGR02543 family)